MNDKPRIQLESLAFPITAHRLGIGKLAYHIMTFNQYIGLTPATNYIRKNKNITEYPTEVADCLQVLLRMRRRSL